MVKEGWRDDGPLWDPRPHLAGRRVVQLVRARYFPAAEVRHEPSNQVVTESGAVGNCVERLRDVHSNGYGLARGLTLVKAREHPSSDGEQGFALHL